MFKSPKPGQPSAAHHDPRLTRYARQVLYPEIGEKGQRQLRSSRATLIGCGALGTVVADSLVRAGVGTLRICDRDFIELNNLQRQVLFDEDDIAAQLPKAEAAARKLRRVNSEVDIQPVVTDINHTNIERHCQDAHLILDGTDNFETRYLINDLAVKSARPWIYTAVVGTTGLCMPITAAGSPCLRCIFERPPPPEMNPTCDTAGVLGPAVSIVAGIQALEAIKILAGRSDAIIRGLVSIDAWTGRFTTLDVQSAYDQGECPCCKGRRFDYLDGKLASSATTLCGRNAVQICRIDGEQVDFNAMTKKLDAASDGAVQHNRYMVRATIGDHQITVFADGRAIIRGTNDADIAKSIFAKYIGA